MIYKYFLVNKDDEMDTDDKIDVDDVEFDYSIIKPEYRSDSSDEVFESFETEIRDLAIEMERLSPNLRALDKLKEVEKKFKDTTNEFDEARNEAKIAKEAFQKIKRKRYKLFLQAFEFISQEIDKIYKLLTKSKTFPLGIKY
jgi:structural maintenance of chromosome 1